MKYVGLSNEQKKEVIEFNHTHLNVDVFSETEAINEAEQAIQETSWNCDVILELPSYFNKSGNPETLNLGKVNDFYISDDSDSEFKKGK